MVKIKWNVRKWRASMTDAEEYTAYLWDKKLNIPFSITVDFNYRDNGSKDYTAIIQYMKADDIRAWWQINTAYHASDKFTEPKKILADVEDTFNKFGKDAVHITYDEYFDWKENHPIQKHRRVGSDWGIYITSKTTSEKGWYDKVYGSIAKTNKYASRWSTEAEANAVAQNLAKNNTGFVFEVRQMGKLDK